MSVLLNFALPVVEICHQFPRYAVFTTAEYLGSGIKHLYTRQEIAKLKDMIVHSNRGQYFPPWTYPDWTWAVETTSPYWLLYLLRSCYLLLDQKYLAVLTLNQPTSRNFNYISLPCKGDEFIMLISPWVSSSDQLLLLNKCQLYLRALYLSDIFYGSGSHILEEAWYGVWPINEYGHNSWPNQGKPSNRAILPRGLHLWQPLGAWMSHEPQWPWYYCLSARRLYHASDQEWVAYKLIEGDTGASMSNIVIAPGATIQLASAISKFHNVTSGSIHFGCNGQSTLARAFSPNSPAKIEESYYEIIVDIHKLLSRSSIEWLPRHIVVHQDYVSTFASLDR